MLQDAFLLDENDFKCLLDNYLDIMMIIFNFS